MAGCDPGLRRSQLHEPSERATGCLDLARAPAPSAAAPGAVLDAERAFQRIKRPRLLDFSSAVLGVQEDVNRGNWQVDWFPEASVAVQVMIVVPRGNRLPEGGTHTIGIRGAGGRRAHRPLHPECRRR